MILVILAGGSGQRMGGADKGLIDIDGIRMIDLIVSKVKPQSRSLYISGTHDYGLGHKVLPDAEDGPKGPAAGLYAAYQALKDSGEVGFFTVPVDGPNLPKDLLNRLHRAECSSIAKDERGLHPVFAWWRFDDLARIFDNFDFAQSQSLKAIAQSVSARHIRWVGDTLFANINTSNDLAGYLNKR